MTHCNLSRKLVQYFLCVLMFVCKTKQLKDQNVKIELALVLVMYINIVIVDETKQTNIKLFFLLSEKLGVYVNQVY